jgi:hypothetical protein
MEDPRGKKQASGPSRLKDEGLGTQRTPTAVALVFDFDPYPDVLIKVGKDGHQFKTHKYILLSRSGVFKAMLQERYQLSPEERPALEDGHILITVEENNDIGPYPFVSFLKV